MTRKYIPVSDLAETWLQNPEFRRAYDALEEEFALAAARIEQGNAHVGAESVPPQDEVKP